MATTDITFQVDANTLAALDSIAARLGQSRDWVVVRAIEKHAREQAAFLDFVQPGIDDLEAGRTHSQEEVEAVFGIGRKARDAA